MGRSASGVRGIRLKPKEKVIGIPTTQVRSSGRATQGVRVIKLEDKNRACSIAKVREN